jgi:ATP-dependent helicase HepA
LKHVVDRLSFQQQRTVTERGHKTLRQLDFAALLRALDRRNWYELSNMLRLPRERRTWVKEMQTVRNKWAHLSSEAARRSAAQRWVPAQRRSAKRQPCDPATQIA